VSVKGTLEIDAEVPNGVPDDEKRVVAENCRTLKFKVGEFDE
jgi:hypothetical protein